jgi:hypothetical protein
MESNPENKGPSPAVFRLVWGAVIVVAIGCVAVVYNAYQAQVEHNQAGIFKPASHRPVIRPPERPRGHELDAPLDVLSLGLRSNLNAVVTAVPNRPHNPVEVRSRTMGDEFKRRRSFTISTDANGIRIPDSRAGKPVTYVGQKKGFRIVAMGASESFGWGVPYTQSYPAQLERLLGVEVVNASAPSRRSMELVVWAQTNLPLLEPDLVIYALRPPYPVTNPVGSFAKSMTSLAEAAGTAPLVVVLPPLSTFDLQMPDIQKVYPQASDIVAADVAAVTQAIAPIAVIGLTGPFRDALSTYNGARPGEVIVTMKTIDGQQVLIAADGSQVLSAEAPDASKRSRFYGVPPSVIASEILSAFEQRPEMREPLFFDGGHPDQDGYRLMAETIASILRDKGLVPSGS